MDYPECSGNPDSCPENEGHGCCGGKDMTACPHGTPHRWPCETCDAPAVPEAVAWADNRAAAGRIGSVESTAVKANWEKTGHFRPAAERLTYPLITLAAAETYAAAREAAALAEVARLRELLARYRDETPLGHQPHMIAHLADKALGRAG